MNSPKFETLPIQRPASSAPVLQRKRNIPSNDRRESEKPDPYATPLHRTLDATLIIVTVLVFAFVWRSSARGNGLPPLQIVETATAPTTSTILISNTGTLLHDSIPGDEKVTASSGALTLHPTAIVAAVGSPTMATSTPHISPASEMMSGMSSFPGGASGRRTMSSATHGYLSAPLVVASMLATTGALAGLMVYHSPRTLFNRS
jgi:hypothetical protein